jgi:hypothetical protein
MNFSGLAADVVVSRRAFRMRFIVRPSCPHVGKADLCLFPDLDRGVPAKLGKG